MASVDADLARAVQAAARFYGDSSPENSAKFDESLLKLINVCSTVDPAARLSLSNASLAELLHYCPLLLAASTTNATTRSRLHRFLFNLTHYNVRVRRFLSGELEMCGPVFDCLKLSLKEQLGPQNMIDILRLLQVLTYERCLGLGIWTNDLISFLLSEVSREEQVEWMPYCIAILCNLANRSKSVCNRIRRSSSYKQFTKRLLKLLSHDSRIVVVSSLVLIGYLEEKLRDMVYCSKNIPQTFQCVFNVLILGDCLMTRHIAADLLKRLVVSDAPSVSATPVITSTGKDLMNYSYFGKCLQQAGGLLVQNDPRLEETTKIYDVFLSFCSLPQMRDPVCTALLDTPVTEARLTTPLVAIARTARMTFDEAIEPTVPLKALQLLNYLLKEAVDNNRRLSQLVPEDRILSIIDSTVKTTIQTSTNFVVYQCQRISEGLRLVEVVSGDDTLRSMLLDVVDAAVCAHISETQLLSNPVVLFMAKPPTHRTEKLPEWSVEGVAIVLELLRVLAIFKDFSKPHKDQYWKSIKDDRLVPLLAFAISHGDHRMVHDALVLYTHCSQFQDFQSRWLGDLIASSLHSPPTKNGEVRTISREGKRLSSEAGNDSLNEEAPITLNGSSTSKQIDELLTKMKEGMDMKNSKTSDILAAYENKILHHTLRERELERLVAAKEAALAQSERLRIQYAAGSTSNEADLARVRTLVTETEILKVEKEKVEEELAKMTRIAEDRMKSSEQTAKDLVESRKECDLLTKENEKEREYATTLRKSIDEFKAKIDKMSKVMLQQKEAADSLTTELENKKDQIYKLNEERKIREQELESSRQQIKQLSDEKKANLDDIQIKTSKISQLADERKRHLKEIENQKTTNTQLSEEIKKLREELEEERKTAFEFRTKYESTQRNADQAKAEIEERRRKLKEEMLRLAGDF